jgi:hypothetical protein
MGRIAAFLNRIAESYGAISISRLFVNTIGVNLNPAASARTTASVASCATAARKAGSSTPNSRQKLRTLVVRKLTTPLEQPHVHTPERIRAPVDARRDFPGGGH